MIEKGAERRVLASYVPDLDAQGKPKWFFVLGSDITSLAKARSELRAEHQRLEMALEGSGAVLWDADLRSGKVYFFQ